MTPATRSGHDRREGWGPQPQCDRHDDLLVSITKVGTTVRTWGVVLSLVWAGGTAVVGWSAGQAISLARQVTKLDTALQLSAADRKVIHEEIKAIEVRVSSLERCIRVADPKTF